jgi:hypothetical protein
MSYLLYYHQFPMLQSHGIKHFMAHRGCPYKCTYCFNHSYNKLYSEQANEKKVFHSRSPDSIVDEVLWLRERVPVNSLYQKFGDLVDGYYLRKGMAYQMGIGEFFTTVRHFLTNYRDISKMSRSASAKQAGAQP